MALYAFDGTWLDDKTANTLEQTDSNVVRFYDAYQGQKTYLEGIGQRKGSLGRVIGGLTGAGGRSRIREALSQLDQNLAGGDRTVDIIGFSRGAALALHFANRMERKYPDVDIRFLGLWDVVASFGIPGNRINIGWQLTLADRVQHCYHMMALDERRKAFPLTRVQGKQSETVEDNRLQEVWFRGVHSDIGSYVNPPLNNISLYWLFQRAIADGLPIDPTKVEACRSGMGPDAAIFQNSGPEGEWRSVLPRDLVHASVKPRGTINGIEHNDPPGPPATVVVGD